MNRNEKVAKDFFLYSRNASERGVSILKYVTDKRVSSDEEERKKAEQMVKQIRA